MADAVDEDFLAACPHLQVVAATLKGYNNYDADACTHHGVWLRTVPDSIIAPTAELALALILAVLRNLRGGDAIVRDGQFAGWRPQLYGASLAGAPVGIVGMGQLGTAVLADVRAGAYLVNMGRGSVVDEHAVLEALERGQLAGYAADVFEMEDWAVSARPECISDALRQHPHTVFTWHLGSAVDSVRRDMSLAAAEQVRQALHGHAPDDAVNTPTR